MSSLYTKISELQKPTDHTQANVNDQFLSVFFNIKLLKKKKKACIIVPSSLAPPRGYVPEQRVNTLGSGELKSQRKFANLHNRQVILQFL